jgi:hypothetical protein
MKKMSRLVAWLTGAPTSAEDAAAKRDAARMRDDLTTTKWSARAPGGEFFEAERRRAERHGN